MELQEFITETITQIVNGVTNAQKKLKDTGCVINPYASDMEHRIMTPKNNKVRAVQKIKMNIVLSLSEKNGGKKGIGVAKIINAGFSNENSNESSEVTSVQFEIPIAFPTMIEVNK